MTAALAEPITPRRPTAGSDDPFRIGYRYVHTVDAGGTKTSRMVPLTEEDFLHPQEEDRFLLTDAHSIAVYYLRHAIPLACRGRSEVRLFTEHRVDWQVPGIPPHGPDVAVFDRFTAEWDPLTGTLPVADLGLETLAVVEVTSEATRHVDLGRKFDEYERVGIPVYLVADVAAPNGAPVLLGFERAGDGYRMMDEDPARGFFVSRLDIWIRLQNERLVVADASGRDIPYAAELADALDHATAQAEAERQRAEAERQRAEAEKARADVVQYQADAALKQAEAEKARADELARELAELKARLSPRQLTNTTAIPDSHP